jgi:hypothetical protein
MFGMNSVLELEKQILALPAAERGRIASFTWDSLIDEPGATADLDFDPEGVALASTRDLEIESGLIKTIRHDEFIKITGG